MEKVTGEALMNSKQRKILRDEHLARLGGIGARVLVGNGRHRAVLHSIDGADRALIAYRNHDGVHSPTTFPAKAGDLEPDLRNKS